MFTDNIRVCLIITCTCILIWETSKSLDRYLKYDTTATLQVIPTSYSTFLAFTICPSFDAAYNDTVLEMYDSNTDTYRNGNYYTPGSDKNPREVFEEVVYTMSEVIGNVNLKTRTADMPYIDIPLDNSKYGRWTSKYHRYFGRCFSLELTDASTTHGITQVVITGKTALYVYMHHPGQFMDYNSMTKILAKTNEKLYIDANFDVTVDNIGHSSMTPCDPKSNFYYDDCLENKMELALIEQFSCAVPYIARNPNLPVCDPSNATLAKEAYNKFKILYDQEQLSLCRRACSNIEVTVGFPFYDVLTKNESFVKVYLKSMIKVRETVYDYQFLTMLGEVGGYTGLLLGVSLIDVYGAVKRFTKKLFASAPLKPRKKKDKPVETS